MIGWTLTIRKSNAPRAKRALESSPRAHDSIPNNGSILMTSKSPLRNWSIRCRCLAHKRARRSSSAAFLLPRICLYSDCPAGQHPATTRAGLGAGGFWWRFSCASSRREPTCVTTVMQTRRERCVDRETRQLRILPQGPPRRSRSDVKTFIMRCPAVNGTLNVVDKGKMVGRT